MKRLFLNLSIVFALYTYSPSAYAQHLLAKGTDGTDVSYAVAATTDGGYISAGYTTKNGNKRWTYFKSDAAGAKGQLPMLKIAVVFVIPSPISAPGPEGGKT